jgi:hypothetical protein
MIYFNVMMISIMAICAKKTTKLAHDFIALKMGEVSHHSSSDREMTGLIEIREIPQ